MSRQSILVIDDDEEIRSLLTRFLILQGFNVTSGESVADLKRHLADGGIDLVILDVILPDGSGRDACQALRAAGDQTPIILATAMHEEIDRIIGLEIGADDYLPKPYSPHEMVARIKAILRRVHAAEAAPQHDGPPRYHVEGLTIDTCSRTLVTETERVLSLTSAEFDLFSLLLSRPNRPVSRDSIIEDKRGSASDAYDRSVDVLVSRVRSKLSAAGIRSDLIKTVRNGGYMLTGRVERL